MVNGACDSNTAVKSVDIHLPKNVPFVMDEPLKAKFRIECKSLLITHKQ